MARWLASEARRRDGERRGAEGEGGPWEHVGCVGCVGWKGEEVVEGTVVKGDGAVA